MTWRGGISVLAYMLDRHRTRACAACNTATDCYNPCTPHAAPSHICHSQLQCNTPHSSTRNTPHSSLLHSPHTSNCAHLEPLQMKLQSSAQAACKAWLAGYTAHFSWRLTAWPSTALHAPRTCRDCARAYVGMGCTRALAVGQQRLPLHPRGWGSEHPPSAHPDAQCQACKQRTQSRPTGLACVAVTAPRARQRGRGKLSIAGPLQHRSPCPRR
jgi:hypothetical protein